MIPLILAGAGALMLLKAKRNPRRKSQRRNPRGLSYQDRMMLHILSSPEKDREYVRKFYRVSSGQNRAYIAGLVRRRLVTKRGHKVTKKGRAALAAAARRR